MKKLIILLLLLICNGAFAQSAIADLKFEEAETAFNDKNYKTVLTKLDEFDKTFGSVTAKSLYLRIVSQDKLLDENETTFGVLVSLRKNVNSYLKAMESEGLDDKYREVYKISGKLEHMPVDDASWIKRKADREKEEKETASRLDNWNYREIGIKLGDTYNTVKSKYPNLRKLRESPTNKNESYWSSSPPDSNSGINITMQNGIVTGYWYDEPNSTNYYNQPTAVKMIEKIVEKIKRDVGDVEIKSESNQYGPIYYITHRGTSTGIYLLCGMATYGNGEDTIYSITINKYKKE